MCNPRVPRKCKLGGYNGSQCFKFYNTKYGGETLGYIFTGGLKLESNLAVSSYAVQLSLAVVWRSSPQLSVSQSVSHEEICISDPLLLLSK